MRTEALKSASDTTHLDILDGDLVIPTHKGVAPQDCDVGIDVPGKRVVVVDEERVAHLAAALSSSVHPTPSC